MNKAGTIAKYFAISLAIEKVVIAPRVIKSCFPISTISMSLVGSLSRSTILPASFAACVPEFIDTPTSACASAGASLVPSLLPGGELPRGIVFETGEADLGQHPPEIHAVSGRAMKLLVEGEILKGGQGRLDAGLMAQVKQAGVVFIPAMADILPIPAHLASKGLGEAGEQAQQAGLAHPVGTLNLHQIPGTHREGEMFKQGAIFTHAAQIVRLKQHGDVIVENEAACILTQDPEASFQRCQ